MAKKSYLEIKRELRNELWPHPTESKALITTHDKMFLEGMMELQKWVPCLQQNNTTTFKQCARYFQCGRTVVEAAPFGVINRVSTIANDDWCDEVVYNPTNYNELECWSRRLLNYTTPTNEGLPALPYGFKFAESTSDLDSDCARARSGMWAVHRHRLYVAPWLQSNETLVVEWDGVKGDWQDTDMLDTELWNPRVLAALRSFVEWNHCLRFGDDLQKAKALRGLFDEQLAGIIHDCREATRQRQALECVNPTPTSDQLTDDAIPDEEAPLVLAAVGDFGSDNANRDLVTDLMDSWEPSLFLSLGDQWYGSTSTEADLLTSIGDWYQAMVADGKFLPCLGNHERTPAGHYPITRAYFTFPKIRTASGDVESPGYYAYTIDNRLSIFVIDTGYDSNEVNHQADGVTASSKQAAWLRVALARSTSAFNIVVGHHNPHTSYKTLETGEAFTGDGRRAYQAIRWPFKTWGADVHLSGHVHSYERLESEGFPYIVCGTGGKDLGGAFDGDMVPESVFADDDHYGALKIECTCNLLTIGFYSTDGVLIDELEIEK